MNKPREINRQGTVFWIVLSILLILRIVLASWTTYLFPATSVWIEPLYEIGTYLLIAFLIWWERARLPLHHLDFWSIVIIIVFKPLSTILLPLMGDTGNPLAFPRWPSLATFVIALILVGCIISKKIDIGKPSRQPILWFIAGGITGVMLFVLYGIIMIRYFGYPVPPNPGTMALIAPFYQLGHAAVAEETVFRGFLWGGLRNKGLKEYWIVLIQSVLFTTAHIHLLDTPQPLPSFGILFMGGIIFGLFVWRSRSLSSSMAAHGFANGSISVQYWVYSRLFR